MKPTQTRPATLPQLLALLFALVPVIAVVTLVLGPGGGHPTLGGVLFMGVAVPTLAAYLSRALEGSDFPSALFLVLAALEYPLVGYGVGSLVARVRSSSGGGLGIFLLVAYIAAQLGAHVVLNQQAVNLRLLADPNPGVSVLQSRDLRHLATAARCQPFKIGSCKPSNDTATPMKP